ncbi:MAG TPA: phospholipid carrier-dependent glycosyltransferase [Syntrophobacteraceae bacterium]|nr:phospholipid carrier-dependent glycosyltransferase [Syntrophobacteraceae bacterium]
MRPQRRKIVLLLGFYVLAYLVFLGERPLLRFDEARYAEIPREMIESGDWVVPRLNGVRYFEKPVLGYWLTALCLRVFGENNFALRLVPALCAGGTAWTVLWTASLGGAGISSLGVASAAVLLSSPLFFALGTLNLLDMPLTLFLTLCFAFFFAAYQSGRKSGRVRFLALLGGAAGGAFLVKGFLGLVLPALGILPFLAWEHKLTSWVPRLWIPILTACLTALPWSLLIHWREPDFWNYFVWEEHWRRFVSEEAQHASPTWYFIPILLVGFFPWSLLLPAALNGLKYAFRDNPLLRLSLCAFALPFLFFSFSSGKLSTYILPCFPPLAILTAAGLLRALEAGEDRYFGKAVRGMIPVCVSAAAGLALVQVPGASFAPYLPEEAWKWVLGSASLLFWAGLTWRAGKTRIPIRKILLVAACPLLAMILYQVAIPAAVEKEISPEEFLRAQKDRVRQGEKLYAEKYLFHAVCWVYKRSDVILFDDPGELDYGLGYEDARDRMVSLKEFISIAREGGEGKLLTLFTRKRIYLEVKDLLPPPVYEARDGGFVVSRYGSVPETTSRRSEAGF